jgi:hypothetical protein
MNFRTSGGASRLPNRRCADNVLKHDTLTPALQRTAGYRGCNRRASWPRPLSLSVRPLYAMKESRNEQKTDRTRGIDPSCHMRRITRTGCERVVPVRYPIVAVAGRCTARSVRYRTLRTRPPDLLDTLQAALPIMSISTNGLTMLYSEAFARGHSHHAGGPCASSCNPRVPQVESLSLGC